MSKTISYYNKNEITKLSQPEALDVKVNQSLLQQAYVIYQGNNQRSIGHTKTRAEVSGTGKKPWKQKGTGRARAGSTRSPLWIGGGITFGPRSNKNYTRKLTVNEKKLALKMLFKLAVDAERLIVIDSLPEVTKTKDAVAWLVKLPIQEGRVLIIDSKIDHLKAFRNLPYVSFQSSLSPHFDRIATSDWIVMTKEAFEKLTGGKINSEPVKPAVKKPIKKEVKS